MLDDINDFNPSSGKPFAADLINGQQNFVTCHLLQEHPELKPKLDDFRRSGGKLELPELDQALHFVLDRSIQLEQDLNRRFSLFTQERAPHLAKVFEKMLSKVREAFTPA
jgi:geranylgeranyl pyrophosphate synthase